MQGSLDHFGADDGLFPGGGVACRLNTSPARPFGRWLTHVRAKASVTGAGGIPVGPQRAHEDVLLVEPWEEKCTAALNPPCRTS